MCRRCGVVVGTEVWRGKWDCHNSDQNVLVRKMCLKYIINSEVHFVGYLYIMDLINAWKMEHIKIM